MYLRFIIFVKEERRVYMWEKDININDVREIRTRTNVYFGVGAIQKIHDIACDIKEKGIDKVIVMSGRNA